MQEKQQQQIVQSFYHIPATKQKLIKMRNYAKSESVFVIFCSVSST